MDVNVFFHLLHLRLVFAGQLADLLYIINESGFPSANRKYIFNGDFVDRGDYGVEVMCLLLVLFVAFPGTPVAPLYSAIFFMNTTPPSSCVALLYLR